MSNQSELDAILELYRLHANMAYSEVEDNFHTAEEFKTLALPKVLAEAKQAILAWHNKHIEEVLDRLEVERDSHDADTGCSDELGYIPLSAIEAERAKLKDTPS